MKNYFKTINQFVDLLAITSVALEWEPILSRRYMTYKGTEYLRSDNVIPGRIYWWNKDSSDSLTVTPDNITNEHTGITLTLRLVVKKGDTILLSQPKTTIELLSTESDKIKSLRKSSLETIFQKEVEDIYKLKHDYVKVLLDSGEDVLNIKDSHN